MLEVPKLPWSPDEVEMPDTLDGIFGNTSEDLDSDQMPNTCVSPESFQDSGLCHIDNERSQRQFCPKSRGRADDDCALQKVLGTNNVADAMTKVVDRWAFDKYMAALKCTLMPGRADTSSRAQ